MSNAGAKAEMQRWVGVLRSLPGLAVKAAPSVAKALHEELTGNFASQRGPDGAPWQPAKDGRQMFQSAPGALDVAAKGPVITARLVGRNLYRHHAGIAKGKIVRPMLPTRNLPEPVSAAIKKVLEDEFQGLLKGKS